MAIIFQRKIFIFYLYLDILDTGIEIDMMSLSSQLHLVMIKTVQVGVDKTKQMLKIGYPIENIELNLFWYYIWGTDSSPHYWSHTCLAFKNLPQ